MVLLFSSSSSSSLSSCYVCLYLRSFCSDLPLSLPFFFFASLSLSHSLTQHFRHTTIYYLRYTAFRTQCIDSTLSLPGHQYHRHGQTRSCTPRDETERNKSKFHNTAETKITLPKMVVGIPPHLHPSRAHHNPTHVCLLSSPLCNISQQQRLITFHLQKPTNNRML